MAKDKAIGFTLAHVIRREIDTSAKWATQVLEERLPRTAVLQYPVLSPLRQSPWWPALRETLKLA